jgi:GT2 family glycosyltransferase
MPGCVGRLADFLLVRQDAAAVGPRLNRPDGLLDEASRRGFPSPMATFYHLTGLGRMFPRSERMNRYSMAHLPATEMHEIDAGTSACLMVRRTGIDRVGFFDPDYVMYGEDLDLCYRLKSGGWKVFYLPTARAVRAQSVTSKQETSRRLLEFHRAMWTFHHKHYAADLPAFANGLVWAGIWARWALKTAMPQNGARPPAGPGAPGTYPPELPPGGQYPYPQGPPQGRPYPPSQPPPPGSYRR